MTIKKKKLLFVNPPNTTSFHATEKGSYIKENIGNQFFILARIPFQVMAAVPEREDIEKEILLLDFEWYKNPELEKEELIKVIKEKNPDFIFTTLIAQSSTDSLDWLTIKIKEEMPDVKIVIGGQGVGWLREKVFVFCPNIDIAYVGNANDLSLFTDCLINNKLENVPNIIYRSNDKIKVNEIRFENEAEIDTEQMYGKFNGLIKNVVDFVSGKNAFVLGMLESYKGCSYQCEFCAAKKPVENKDIENMLDELEYLYSKGINKFYIIDLTFGLNPARNEDVINGLKLFKKKNSDFGFRCVTRADRINEKFAMDLLEAGCYEVGIGVEVNDDLVLKMMKKHTGENLHLNAVDIMGKSGLNFKLFLIEGYTGSSSESSRKTFLLLNYLQEKNYRYFIQPALSRDIMPLQKGFREREERGILRRGNMNQLDLRHDGRQYKWDNNRSIRSICLQILGYPSTELGKEWKNLKLQKRAIIDLPFLVSGNIINEGINFFKDNEIKKVIVHFLDGVYTEDEITEKLIKIYPDAEKSFLKNEIKETISILGEKGIIDSFGSPNMKADYNKEYSCESDLPRRNNEMLLFFDSEKYFVYLPKGEIKKISSSFYKNIPEDVITFLILARGIFDLRDISEKMHLLLKNKKGFEDNEESFVTASKIYETCCKYGFCL